MVTFLYTRNIRTVILYMKKDMLYEKKSRYLSYFYPIPQNPTNNPLPKNLSPLEYRKKYNSFTLILHLYILFGADIHISIQIIKTKKIYVFKVKCKPHFSWVTKKVLLTSFKCTLYSN